MSKMKGLKILSMLCAAGTGGVATVYYFERRRVDASWTTNFTPSVKWDDNWDRRDPASLVKPQKNADLNNNIDENPAQKPTTSRHLFFIRHGQYIFADKDKDKKLTQIGKEQVAHTGQRLKDLKFNYTHLVVSTMTRARESGEIIVQYLPSDIKKHHCDLIREGAPIPPEPPVGSWRPEAHQFFIDGSRIEAGFRKYFHRTDISQKKDSYEVYVCHANVIRYYVCRALQLPPEAWLRMGLHNASITWLTIRPSGRVSMRTLGDSGHIPAEKLTSN